MTSSSEKFMFNTQREGEKKEGAGGGSRERDRHSNKEREKRGDHNVSFHTSAPTAIHQLKP